MAGVVAGVRVGSGSGRFIDGSRSRSRSRSWGRSNGSGKVVAGVLTAEDNR